MINSLATVVMPDRRPLTIRATSNTGRAIKLNSTTGIRTGAVSEDRAIRIRMPNRPSSADTTRGAIALSKSTITESQSNISTSLFNNRIDHLTVIILCAMKKNILKYSTKWVICQYIIYFCRIRLTFCHILFIISISNVLFKMSRLWKKESLNMRSSAR